MTDFYVLLKQSIIERDIRDSGDRQAVYAHARQAVIKQLWAFRPPLAADEIDTRVGAYDAAVERIEADLIVAFANGEMPERPKAGRRPQPPAPEVEDEEPARALSEWRHEDDNQPAPPLAAWRHDAPEDETPDGLADELADGREYRRGVSRAKTVDSAPAAVADDREGYDEEASYQQDAPRDARDDAWRDRWGEDDGDGTMSRSRGKWLPAISKRDKIQILAGAIAAMAIALIALGLYFYFPRENDGVTLAIGVRREVSDAATAARIPTDKLAVVQTYAVFDGRDPTIFATTPDNPVRFDAQGGFARVSSSASAPGVKVTIGPGLAARLAGQRVRIVILARSSTELGAVAMRFAYQSGVAISHWQTASLAPEYEAAGMVWRVPTMRTSPAGDYLVIEPGIPGDGTGVDIKSIKIDMLADEGS